jgi:rhodanese-related sulfurtransferase
MFKQVFTFCIIAILLGLGARVVQENPVPFWGFPRPIDLLPVPTTMAAEAANKNINEAFAPAQQPYAVDYMTVFGLYAKRKKENIHFVDARDEDLFAAGHIPGSVNIPFENLNESVSALEQIPRDELLVIYCDGGDCHLSHDLAEYALASGWTRIAVYEDGWEEWSVESDFIAKGNGEDQ